MDQTKSPNPPNRTAPQKAVTPPAAAPKTEPSRAPAPQIPSAATTTTMVRPVNATMEEQNLPPYQPQKTPRPKPPDPDPCPYGMHSIGNDYGILNCAFN